MPRDSVANTLKVAFLLCLACSLLVSGTAVGLRSRQLDNKADEMRKNVLKAAGLWHDGDDISERFKSVDVRAIELATGEETDAVDPATYDPRAALNSPIDSAAIPAAEDIAEIKRLEKYEIVYLVKDADGAIDQIVLPIRGYGLWSTLWGFISLDAAGLADRPEVVKVRGITFFEHKETPGLGGEVDNPTWKDRWSDPDQPKYVFDADWNVLIQVVKGSVLPDDPDAKHQVDGLAGATFTTAGVRNMLHFWLGESGFGPYLKHLHEDLAKEGASRD